MGCISKASLTRKIKLSCIARILSCDALRRNREQVVFFFFLFFFCFVFQDKSVLSWQNGENDPFVDF